MNVLVHPLVVMNASEHWTRNKVQSNQLSQAIGALLGKQIDLNIEISNSFEIRYDVIEDAIIIDKEYLKFKEDHFKQVFPNFELLGWYCAGFENLKDDIDIQKQMCDLYENPIMMKLYIDNKKNELPIKFFESIIDFENGQAKIVFKEIQYQLVTEEAERVGLEHIVNNNDYYSNQNHNDSLVTNHLLAQQNAIKMLNSRLKIIIDYIKAVKNGQLPPNYEILREASSLINRLPIDSGDPNKTSFYTVRASLHCSEGNDVALLSYIGAITKTCDTVNQFINKFNSLHDKQAASRRMRGLLF